MKDGRLTLVALPAAVYCLNLQAVSVPISSEEHQSAEPPYSVTMLGRHIAPKENDKFRGYTVNMIAHAYHGLLLDKNHEEIPMDQAMALRLQKSLVTDLLQLAQPKAAEAAKNLIARLSLLREFDDKHKLLVNNAIVSQLLESSSKEVVAHYQWRYRTIRSNTWRWIHDLKVDPRVGEVLQAYPVVVSWLSEYFRQLSYTDYMSDCADYDVPIPPDFPDSDWIFQGELSPQDNFLGAGDVDIYTYENVDGVCYALPREERLLMGIICQSESTGKACFWDNISKTTGNRVDWRTTTVDIHDLQDGSMLGENCTNCHRGENAFIIHPESNLDVPGVDRTPAVWYEPIGQAGWTNPGPLALPASNDGSCETCHQLPSLGTSYCTFVLAKAAEETMPSSSEPVGWPANGGAYSFHVKHLQTLCP